MSKLAIELSDAEEAVLRGIALDYGLKIGRGAVIFQEAGSVRQLLIAIARGNLRVVRPDPVQAQAQAAGEELSFMAGDASGEVDG